MASLVKTDKISTTAGGAQEFTLPAADGTANQHLKTDGSGVLGWASPPSANPLTLTGSTNTWIPTITGADALTGTANFTYDGNTLDVKNSGTASSIKLYCETSNQHYQEIKAAPHAGSANWTLTLPPNDGNANEFLQTNGSGVTTWATAGGNNTPAFQAYLNANQTIPYDTSTKVTFQAEDFDTDNAYDNTTNYRFTVPAGEGGKYYVYFRSSGGAGSSSQHNKSYSYIYLNGSAASYATFDDQQNGKGESVSFYNAAILTLAAADYLECFYYLDTANSASGRLFEHARGTMFGAYKMIGL